MVSSVLSFCLGCASAQDPASSTATSSPTSEAGTSETSGASTTSPVNGDGAATANTTSTSTATPSTSPTASAAPTAAVPEGPAKDANALIIEPVFTAKGGGKVPADTVAELTKSFHTRLAASSKMAHVGAAGVSTARHVVATFLLEAPVTDDKGLTVKMGFTGVESLGKCPVFDLDQRLTMSGGKNTPADVLELQKAAVTALLEKLEQSASTLKPKANCTASKPAK